MKTEQNAVLKELRDNIKNVNTMEEELKLEKERVKEELKLEKGKVEEELKLEKGKVEEELKLERAKFDHLKKMVECPICLEVPRKGPIFMCPNGHFLCKKCRRENCPTCRA